MTTKLLLFRVLLGCNFTCSQATLNQSLIGVQSSISIPIAAQSGKVFRFRSGLVTQLDLGTNFDLSSTSPLNCR